MLTPILSFLLPFFTLVNISSAAPSTLHPRITDTLDAYCQSDPRWYTPQTPTTLDAPDCKTAIQRLKDDKVAKFGSRNLSFGRNTTDPRTNPLEIVPQFYPSDSGKCVLTIFMRDMATVKFPDIVTEWPDDLIDLQPEDDAMYTVLVEAAEQCWNNCVWYQKQAGWYFSGESHSIAVAFWGVGSEMDVFLEGFVETKKVVMLGATAFAPGRFDPSWVS